MRPSAFTPQQRELVFDIDMTDYDSVRTCCTGADICVRCWGFIAAAVRVLDHAIRDQFGFQHLLWVYSGRRGIHLWISDPEALVLTDEQRKSIVGWLGVISGGKEMHKKVNVRMGVAKLLPPSLQCVFSTLWCELADIFCRTALGPLAEQFGSLILCDQDCFASREGWEALLHLIPGSAADKLSEVWGENPDRCSEDKWEDFKNYARKLPKGGQQRVSNLPEFTVLLSLRSIY